MHTYATVCYGVRALLSMRLRGLGLMVAHTCPCHPLFPAADLISCGTLLKIKHPSVLPTQTAAAQHLGMLS